MSAPKDLTPHQWAMLEGCIADANGSDLRPSGALDAAAWTVE